MISDGPCGALAKSGVAGPGVDIHDHGLAVRLDYRITAEDLQPKRGCSAKCCPAQRRDLEGITQHALVTVIEPFEPVGVHGERCISHSVEFDEVSRHMFLCNYKRDAAF